MKAEFQIIRDGAIIFKCEMAPKNNIDFANESRAALVNFFRLHPDASLLDEDLIMKWAEVEKST